VAAKPTYVSSTQPEQHPRSHPTWPDSTLTDSAGGCSCPRPPCYDSLGRQDSIPATHAQSEMTGMQPHRVDDSCDELTESPLTVRGGSLSK
jgi:hypothetical protein